MDGMGDPLNGGASKSYAITPCPFEVD